MGRNQACYAVTRRLVRRHHVGSFPELEYQMTGFKPDLDLATQGSPDRVGALIRALAEVMLTWSPTR